MLVSYSLFHVCILMNFVRFPPVNLSHVNLDQPEEPRRIADNLLLPDVVEMVVGMWAWRWIDSSYKVSQHGKS